MSGPFCDALLQLEGPAVPWESRPFAMPASGEGHDFGLAIGTNRGMIGAYFKTLVANNGYATGDVVSYHPDLTQPVGSPGGAIATRFNPGRLTARVAQGLYGVNKTAGSSVDFAGNAGFRLLYRGIFAGGLGPYAAVARGLAPAGPLVAGQTPEFAFTAPFSEVGNPSGIEPFMWTLFGRCLVADGGCAPGDVMAFGTCKGAGTVRGWTTSYSPDTQRFCLSQYSSPPQLVGKAGTIFVPTVASWAFFFRFVGAARGPSAMRPPMRQAIRGGVPRLWVTPSIPFAPTLAPISFALPEGFTPALVNSFYICRVPEYGYGVNDWVVAQEGDNNAQNGGFSATFSDRRLALAPQTFSSNQYIHSLVDGSFNLMTAANWSWFFAFVG